MNEQKGQIWSLDVVLAGVLFTLAIGLILSQTELGVFNSQQERNARDLYGMGWYASNVFATAPEVIITSPPSSSRTNIRCGPHASGWSVDNDLSWMPNCIVDYPGDITASDLGLPDEYAVGVHATGVPSLNLTPVDPPAGSSFVSVARSIIVLPATPAPPDAVLLRTCLEGGCASYVREVTITIWRKP